MHTPLVIIHRFLLSFIDPHTYMDHNLECMIPCFSVGALLFLNLGF